MSLETWIPKKGKRGQVARYFAPFPRWAPWTLGVAVVFLPSVGSMVDLAVVAVVGSLAGWALVVWCQKPSDTLVDAWMGEDLATLEDRALWKVGLDPSELLREPVTVVGPRIGGTGGAELRFRKGRDGKLRYTPIDTTVIHFTESQLVLYRCALDLTTGNPLEEGAEDYFYEDVVTVATRSESVSYEARELHPKLLARLPKLDHALEGGKLQLNSAETFSLTTRAGTSLRVVLRDPVLIQSAGGGELPTEMADRAVRVVRKMLRERKASPRVSAAGS